MTISKPPRLSISAIGLVLASGFTASAVTYSSVQQVNAPLTEATATNLTPTATWGDTTTIWAEVDDEYREYIAGLEENIQELKETRYNLQVGALETAIKQKIRTAILAEQNATEDDVIRLFGPTQGEIEQNIPAWCDENDIDCDPLHCDNYQENVDFYKAEQAEEKLQKAIEQRFDTKALALNFTPPAPFIAEETTGQPPLVHNATIWGIGNPQAVVQIDLYSDFNCGYCSDLSLALTEVMSSQPDDIYLRHHHYPSDDFGMELALYSECAGKHGKFWEYYIFVHHQPKISGANQIATAIGLPSADLEACLEDGTTEILQAQVEKAESLAIVGTPTFYINGQQYQGSKSVAFLRGVIQPLIE